LGHACGRSVTLIIPLTFLKLASLSAETKFKTETRIVSEDLSTREALFYNHIKLTGIPGAWNAKSRADFSEVCRKGRPLNAPISCTSTSSRSATLRHHSQMSLFKGCLEDVEFFLQLL
jgi:hypothetical protein